MPIRSTGHNEAVRNSLRLGRLFGIPIGMHWSVAAVVVLLTYVLATSTLRSFLPDTSLTSRIVVAAAGAAAFLLSLIGHELGHALTARRHGIEVEGITLWLLGGFARLSRQPRTPGAEFWVAIAGPAANVVLAGGFALGAVAATRYDAPELVRGVLSWLVVVNLLLAITNLLPGAPLDGGRVLTAIIWKRTGDAELARLRSARVGLGIGAAVVVLGLLERFRWSQETGWGTLLVGAFVLFAAKGEIGAAALRRRLQATPLSAIMSAHPSAVHESMTIQQFLDHHGPGPERALPVVRWGSDPIGYVAPSLLLDVGQPERSWTSLGRCMLPLNHVPRAWTSESVAALMDRSGGAMPSMVVLHEPRRGQPIGTLSRGQVRHLVEMPIDFWGREGH